MLAGHGDDVDHVTLFRWVKRLTSLLIDAARPVRHLVSGALACRRDLRQGLLGLALRLPGRRPAWPPDRRVRATAPGHRLGAVLSSTALAAFTVTQPR